jgi:hypothetical protein
VDDEIREMLLAEAGSEIAKKAAGQRNGIFCASRRCER